MINIKGLLIGVGVLLAVGACAGMASCSVDSARILQVDAVEYDAYEYELPIVGDELPYGVTWTRSIEDAQISDDGYYAVRSVRIGYSYEWDDYDDLPEIVITSWDWMVSFWAVGNPAYPNNTLTPREFGFILVDMSDHGIKQLGCAGSTSVSSLYSVPASVYLHMIDGLTHTAPEDLTASPMFFTTDSDDWRSDTLSGSVAYYLDTTYGSVVRNAVDMFAQSIANHVAGEVQYAREEYGNEKYEEGKRTGYNIGRTSATTADTAINTLFGSLWGVSSNVLNGLMPLVLWDIPIVQIIITFCVLGLLVWLIRRFI